jgi:hypothetical protein
VLNLGWMFAAGLPPDLDLKNNATSSGGTGGIRDVLLIVGVVMVLGLALFLYVYATRQKRRGRTETGSQPIYRAERRLVEETHSEGRRRKKRRRSEEFAQRNPTLGETGGLPPLRTDDPAEPAP